MVVLFLVALINLSNVFCDLSGKRESRCHGYSFRCSNGQCIPLTNVCDGAVDCRDRSDETLAVCTNFIRCPPYAFRCAYGACVDKATICNGVQDCADNSDELLPQCIQPNPVIKKCNTYEFLCNSGECIDELLVCDGKEDCVNGSDETITQCINFKCPAYGLRCAYGGCIDKEKQCDGTEDCKDGSDEDSEVCSKKIPEENSAAPADPTDRTRERGSCQLPEKPDNGNYEVTDCSEGDYTPKCSKIPGTIVRSNVIIEYSCKPGYVLPENRNYSYCKSQGVWDPEPPQCLKMCKGVQSNPSMDLDCYYGDLRVNCEQLMKPGTELRANCKFSYHISDSSASFTSTVCLPDGTLASKLYKCVPVCGIRNTINDVTTTIAGGQKIKRSEYPWHAGLYQIEAEVFINICGGTIIHPKGILTVAHCVYDKETNSLRDKKTFRVAVGKYKSHWNIKEPTEQRFLVKQIIIPDNYEGELNRYALDIAILHLENIIKLNAAVMPVCLDRENSLRLSQAPKAVGTVVGWGGSESDSDPSDELKVAKFPVIGFHDCHKQAQNSRYITYDKICAGLSHGPSVVPGDSGGSMTFSRFYDNKEEYFIYGIVSLRPTLSTAIAAFTNVTVHMKWIEDTLKAID